MVYFIQRDNNGPIKIGHAKDPEQRLESLQTGSPERLRLLTVISGGYALEKELHEKYSKYKLYGEWFEPSKSIIAYIENHRDPEIAKPTHPGFLNGKWFHSYDENSEISWQGQILSFYQDWILIQFYSWSDGSPTEQKIVNIFEAKEWSFYETDYDMRYAYHKKRGLLHEFEANEKALKNRNKFLGRT